MGWQCLTTGIGCMESLMWGRETGLKAGTEVTVRNGEWKEVNELNNYLDIEVTGLGQWYVRTGKW